MGFFFADVDAFARFQAFAIKACQITVIILLRGVEVDAVEDAVGVTFFFDDADEVDLLGNMVSGFAPDFGFENV